MRAKQKKIFEPDTPVKKRPVPPKGYVRFYHKNNTCPRCGNTGTVWYGSDWQDDEIVEKLLFLEGVGCYNGYSLHNTVLKDNQTSCNHWSRFCTGKCCSCGLKYWHDFIIDDSEKKKGDREWWKYHEPFDLGAWEKAKKDLRVNIKGFNQVALFEAPLILKDWIDESRYF